MNVQLIYVSDNYTGKGEIDDILEKSRTNNANLEITGILLLTFRTSKSAVISNIYKVYFDYN